MLGDLLLDVETDMGEIFKVFFCRGCHKFHHFQLNTSFEQHWNWNGDNKKPTFTPALKVKDAESKEVMCHLSIKDGKIKYYPESKHNLAGTTVNMERA